MRRYADIIIDISHEAVDRVFQYAVPDELIPDIDIGDEVIVPFGRGNTERKGYVTGFSDETSYDESKIKEIIGKSDTISINKRFIKLAFWIKTNFGGTMIQALKTVLPVKERIKAQEKKTVIFKASMDDVEAIRARYVKRRSSAKLRLFNELIEEKALPYEIVRDKLHISSVTLKSMEKDEVIEILSSQEYRQVAQYASAPNPGFELNEQQKNAIESVAGDFEKGIINTYLLYGVTGSGKTEVYIECIRRAVASGKQAIMLIPEIALTYQTVKRFRRVFGDRVTILHSKLSKGEKYDQYLRVTRGEVDVVIGPRSALFVPFDRLGLIVIDEEHESSYKSDKLPAFHAREVAEYIAKDCGASLLLGSATPSVTSFYRARRGEIKLISLPERAGAGELAEVELTDLREELKKGNRTPFGAVLKRRIEDALSANEQVMLFINRRGFESSISCRSCGEVITCPHCDVALTSHGRSKLICHYCGYEVGYTKECPACGAEHLAGFKMGTEKLVELTEKTFPGARVLRMDTDTVRRKGGHEEILEKFALHEADILVGTQMIVKGHDFANVTVMGIMLADMSLNDADYMAAERTFELLTQAAGRAGRADKKGFVVIQTYRPDHYSIVNAMKQDYDAFFGEEIAYREMLGFPPAYHMLGILVTSEKEAYADALALNIADHIKREFASEDRRVKVIGPGTSIISKINDVYRRVVYVRHTEHKNLVEIKDEMEAVLEKKGLPSHARILFDFDPVRTL